MRDNGRNRPSDRGWRSSTQKGEWGMLNWKKTYALAAILALGMLVCFATRAAAQEGKMAGTIIDFDGNPWANLPVKIKSDVGMTTESKTDAAGKFSFTGFKNVKNTFTVHPPHIHSPSNI